MLAAESVEVVLCVFRVHELDGTREVRVALCVLKSQPHLCVIGFAEVRQSVTGLKLATAAGRSLIEKLLFPPVGCLVLEVLVNLSITLLGRFYFLLNGALVTNNLCSLLVTIVNAFLNHDLAFDVLEFASVSRGCLLRLGRVSNRVKVALELGRRYLLQSRLVAEGFLFFSNVLLAWQVFGRGLVDEVKV